LVRIDVIGSDGMRTVSLKGLGRLIPLEMHDERTPFGSADGSKIKIPDGAGVRKVLGVDHGDACRKAIEHRTPSFVILRTAGFGQRLAHPKEEAIKDAGFHGFRLEEDIGNLRKRT
jgi:hypothetical protein